MEKTGWLKKQLNQVEQEVREWPKWKQDVHTQKTKNEPVSSTQKPTRQHEREKLEVK